MKFYNVLMRTAHWIVLHSFYVCMCTGGLVYLLVVKSCALCIGALEPEHFDGRLCAHCDAIFIAP